MYPRVRLWLRDPPVPARASNVVETLKPGPPLQQAVPLTKPARPAPTPTAVLPRGSTLWQPVGSIEDSIDTSPELCARCAPRIAGRGARSRATRTMRAAAAALLSATVRERGWADDGGHARKRELRGAPLGWCAQRAVGRPLSDFRGRRPPHSHGMSHSHVTPVSDTSCDSLSGRFDGTGCTHAFGVGGCGSELWARRQRVAGTS